MAVPWREALCWSSEYPEQTFSSFPCRNCWIWGSDEGWQCLPLCSEGSYPHPLPLCVWGRSLLIQGWLHFLLALPTVPCPSLALLHVLDRLDEVSPHTPVESWPELLCAEPLCFLPCPGIADGPAGTENTGESAWSLCPGGSREVMGSKSFPAACPGMVSEGTGG